jgi:hypothetical protein
MLIGALSLFVCSMVCLFFATFGIDSVGLFHTLDGGILFGFGSLALYLAAQATRA